MRKATSAKPKPRKASKARVAGPARLSLGASCTLREAAALRTQLQGTVSKSDHVILEAGAVEHIDTVGLQLLVAFARREQAAGRRLEWQSPSHELLVASARLGLTEALALTGFAGKTA
jgi:anti-anti-sigma regulatory factor